MPSVLTSKLCVLNLVVPCMDLLVILNIWIFDKGVSELYRGAIFWQGCLSASVVSPCISGIISKNLTEFWKDTATKSGYTYLRSNVSNIKDIREDLSISRNTIYLYVCVCVSDVAV